MKISAHLVYTPEPEVFEILQTRLDPEVKLTTGEDIPNAADYHILIAGRPSHEQLTASPNLHSLLIPFAGLPSTTRDLMREFPHIAVHNLHHNAISTAETALTLMLAAAKFTVPADRNLRQGDWTLRYENPAVLMYGKTALILGYGAIGRHLGQLCQTLGMRVIATRRQLKEPVRENGVEMYPAGATHDLLPQADVLLLCLPLTDETQGSIGQRELSLLPDRAILVNIGRGAIIDEEALYHALKDGTLYAAGIDVWYTYPTDEPSRGATQPATFPFHELDNIVMSPHRAGSGSTAEVERMRMEGLAAALNQAAAGQPLPHQVDLEAGY
jgi:phosphoglycerate dehydrogenase-like enzyme